MFILLCKPLTVRRLVTNRQTDYRNPRAHVRQTLIVYFVHICTYDIVGIVSLTQAR